MFQIQEVNESQLTPTRQIVSHNEFEEFFFRKKETFVLSRLILLVSPVVSCDHKVTQFVPKN